MQGLALIDFDNFRERGKKSKVDLEIDAQTVVDSVARTFAATFPDAHELDVRLYGGWTDQNGLPSRDAYWLHELLPDLRGRQHGLIVRPALATTMIRFPEFLLRGTVRGRNQRQKMIDGMMGCDALYVAAQGQIRIGLVTDDDDLLPAALSAHDTNAGMLVWIRTRSIGSAVNDSFLESKGLPGDDSALQWSQTGTGLTANPARTFERLYERYVARYDSSPIEHRSDEDVWRPVRDKLMERGIKVPFEPRTVVGAQDRIVFERAWKNGRWHACEPVSLDMTDAEAIMDKARRWRGHLAAVADGASERIDLHFLLGRPQNGSLMSAYETAKAILAHASFVTDVVEDNDIDAFVASMERACLLDRCVDPDVSPWTMNR